MPARLARTLTAAIEWLNSKLPSTDAVVGGTTWTFADTRTLSFELCYPPECLVEEDSDAFSHRQAS